MPFIDIREGADDLASGGCGLGHRAGISLEAHAILVFPMLLLVAICEVVRASSDAETGFAALPRAKRTLRLAIALGATSDVRAE